MDAERGLEQVNLLLAHLGVEPRIRVLEDDGRSGVEEFSCVLGLRSCIVRGGSGAGGGFLGNGRGDGVDVGPFAGAAAAGGRIPFLAEGSDEGFVVDVVGGVAGAAVSVGVGA